MIETIEGIIIKKIPYGIKDEIVTILTNKEILTMISIGTNKIESKNRYAIQLGNIANIEFFRARLNNKISRLKKATIIKQPPLNIGDTAQVIMSILKTLNFLSTSNDDLYHSIWESYDYLGNDNNHHIKTYITFRVLSPMGLTPSTNCCVICKRTDRIHDFSFYSGGFLCTFHKTQTMNIKKLKSYYAITKTINDYIFIDSKENFYIYKELISFIEEHNF